MAFTQPRQNNIGNTLFLNDSQIGIGTNNPNQLLTLEGSMSIKEQANANSDTDAYGQLWVKNSTPNELYFTNDSGNDIQLTSGTSIAGDLNSNITNSLLYSNHDIFINSSNEWSQLGSDIDGEAADNYSGISVSLSADGTIVAIGAPFNDGTGSNAGHVRIYKYNGSAWSQLGSDIDGEATGDFNGTSVSLSADGTIVAIGAPGNDGTGSDAGHTRIYKYNGSAWSQLGSDIDGEAASDQSGYSVSLSADGTIVAIGAPYNDGTGSNAGHTRIYKYNGSAWSQLGSDIDGEAASDQSGYSVSLSADGTIVAIGALFNDGTGSDAGHTRIYKYNGSAWSQLGSDIDGEAAGDKSGYSVSLSADGTIVAIGAIGNDGTGSDAGHSRIYKYNGSAWSQLGSDIDGEAASDQSGYSVSLSADGTIVAIGATGNDGTGSGAGHTRIYKYNGSAWSQLGSDIDGEAASDQSGASVSLSADGTIVAIGAPFNDGTGSDEGHVRVYNIAEEFNNVLINNNMNVVGNVGIGTTSPNQLLTLEGSMSIKEQASAGNDTDAYGQLWVKNSTPNELYFTTDAGNDIQLTSGTSIAGGGGAVSAVSNGANNRIATFSSSDALNGEANLTFDGTTLKTGSGSADGIISSNGNHNLILQTGNSTTGNITIEDGTSGKIFLKPNEYGLVVIDPTNGNANLTAGSGEDLILTRDLKNSNNQMIQIGGSNLDIHGDTIRLYGPTQVSKDTDAEFIALKLTNRSDAADTTGQVSIQFDLEDTSGNTVDAGKILVLKEQSFTSTSSTQDSSMTFSTSLNGTLSEKMRINSSGNVGIGTTSPNQLLTVEGTMSLKEQASANSDTAAYGQLWVKNSEPNELYFTTDAGNDIQLTSGTSIAGGGGGGGGAVSAVSNGANNRIATFSSSDALNGEANLTFDGNLLTLEGTMSLKEQASANSDTAAYGQLWVKNSEPNELYFTNDNGDDIPLTISSGVSTHTGATLQVVNNNISGVDIYTTLSTRWVNSSTPRQGTEISDLETSITVKSDNPKIMYSAMINGEIDWNVCLQLVRYIDSDTTWAITKELGNPSTLPSNSRNFGIISSEFDNSQSQTMHNYNIQFVDTPTVNKGQTVKYVVSATTANEDTGGYVYLNRTIFGDGSNFTEFTSSQVNLTEINTQVDVELAQNGNVLNLQGTGSGTGDGDQSTTINLKNNDSTPISYGQILASHDGSSSDTKGRLTISTHTGSSLTEAMRIDSDGNVGIGTTSPMNTLQVSHTGADGDNGLIIVREDTSTAANDLLGGIGFDSTDGNVPSSILEASAYIAGYASENHSTGDKGGYLTFGTSSENDNDDTTSKERMRITDEGNVKFYGYDSSGSLTSILQISQLLDSINPRIGFTFGRSESDITNNMARPHIHMWAHNTNPSLVFYANRFQFITTDPWNTSNNKVNKLNISNEGRVGINKFEDDLKNTFEIHHAGSDGDDGMLIVRDDTSTAANDLLGGIGFDSNDGDGSFPSSILEASAYIAGYASENHSDSDKGGYLTFGTAPDNQNKDVVSSERMRITSSGNVGIGTTSPYCQVQIGVPSRGDGETSELGKLVVAGPTSTPTQDFTNSTAIFRVIGTDATNCIQMGVGGSGYSYNPWIQAGGDNTGGGGSNAPFNKDLLLNPLGGNVGIGTTDPAAKLQIKQISNQSSDDGSGLRFVQNGNTNRWDLFMWSDDNFVFHYNGNPKGFIHDSGSNSQFNFTGQHCCLSNNSITTSSIGLIVSASGNYIDLNNQLGPTINDSLPIVQITNTDNDKKVFGVLSDKEDTENSRRYGPGNFVSVYDKTNTNEQRLFINSVGEGGIWICNKGSSNIENGDYITSSSVTGYGMKQTLHEGLLTNFTVAKITCDCNFSLEKITKQKLKVITTTTDGVTTTTTSPEGITTTTTSDPITTTAIDYDESGNVQYEDDLDENGNTQQVYKYETRFLDASGNLLIDEADYNTRLGNEEHVYIACFVGCTYHCG